jgi:hypothetical protein
VGGGGLSQGVDDKRLDDEIMSDLLWMNLEKVSDKVSVRYYLWRVHGTKRTYLAPRIHGLFIT